MTPPRCRGIEMQDNFLAIETPLVERLKAQLADLSPKVHVLTANDTAGVEEAKQLTPAVHVTYLDYDIQSIPPMDASAVRITQHWLIWVCVRNVRDVRSGAAARNAAGALALRVLQALLGFVPIQGEPAIRPEHAQARSGASEAGFYYLPLSFSWTSSYEGKTQ